MDTPDNAQGSLSRREFFKVFGGGLAFLFLYRQAPAMPQAMPQEISAWLHIAENGAVTVYTGKVEVGQNIRTSLAQIVAEELRVPMASIQMVMGDTDLTPFDRGTFGSLTTPQMMPRLRSASAAAREKLIDLAAEAWRVNRGSVTLADGLVLHRATGRTAGFGSLTRGRKMVEMIGDVPLTPVDQWTVAGTSVPKVGGRDYVTGVHAYVSDMKLPGMLIGSMLRPPAFGASLVSIDTSRAAALPGVTVVHEGDFVGVAAPDAVSASRAVEAIRAEWNTTAQPAQSELFPYLKQHASTPQNPHQSGDMQRGLTEADFVFNESYTIDYIAHAPMEPRAALAQWEGDRLTVWTGTQRPFGVKTELARALEISEDRVRVIMPDTGSAYGGKHSGEAAVEAARLAREAGRPVKLVWSRQEEFTWAYFRPAGVIEISSGVRSDGTVTAWSFRNFNSGGAGIRTPYEVANQHIAFHPSRSPLRPGSYRALASTANAFAREIQMDQMARAVEMDALAFRLKNLRDDRLRDVFQAAARAFGWGGAKPPVHHGFGIAGSFDKGGYTATCAEVYVDPVSRQVRVTRVVQAFECGTIINPVHLQGQVEGCLIQGLGGALFESIAFEDGKILNPAFSRYRVPRFMDTPPIETVLLNRKDLPAAGAGETPIVSIAPAIGNAIFDATGVRLRSLPMAPNGLQA